MKSLDRQRGLTTVEFAVIGLTVILIILAVIEMGRAMFVMSTLAEATRRAARVAVVCPINDAAILRAATMADAPGGPPFRALTPDIFEVQYLDQNGGLIGNPQGSFNRIRYVRVRVNGYVHSLVLPIPGASVASPAFETVLPRESLGIPRTGTVTAC